MFGLGERSFLSCCSPKLSTEDEGGTDGRKIQFPKRRVVAEHVAVDTVHRPTDPAFDFAVVRKVQISQRELMNKAICLQVDILCTCTCV